MFDLCFADLPASRRLLSCQKVHPPGHWQGKADSRLSISDQSNSDS
jgi:hypothetical protein